MRPRGSPHGWNGFPGCGWAPVTRTIRTILLERAGLDTDGDGPLEKVAVPATHYGFSIAAAARTS